MKFVLHIGMAKAGSTALQNHLLENKPALAAQGVLYPAGGTLPRNHNLLVCGMARPKTFPRLFRQVYKGAPERAAADLGQLADGIAAQIRHTRPTAVILSAEMLFRPFAPDAMATLGRWLGGLLPDGSGARDITLLCYLREPGAQYISRTQQELRATDLLPPLAPEALRAVLESFEPLSARLALRRYEACRTAGRPLAQDLVDLACPGARLGPEPEAPANPSLSAEAMDILQSYRRAHHAGRRDRFTADTGALIRALARAEPRVPGAVRPVIGPLARAQLLTGATDLVWLRDRHGIAWPEVDYALAAAPPAPEPVQPQRIADLCRVDPARREALAMAVLHRFATSKTANKPVRFSSALPQDK